MLAAWCRAAGNPPAVQPAKKIPSEVDALKKEVWAMLKAKIGPDITPDSANQFLWDNEILDGGNVDHVLSKLNESALRIVIEKVKNL